MQHLARWCGVPWRLGLLTALALLARLPRGCAWGALGGLGGHGPPPGDRSRDLAVLSRHLRYVLYPESSTMGLFLAIAIPLDLPEKDVSVSWNFEANYALPYNATELAQGPGALLVRRARAAVDRTRIYALIEGRLSSEGLPGRACLLRSICEAAETPLRHNGLVGDLLHVLLTPSASEDEGLPREFAEAETHGTAGGDCARFVPAADCPVSVLDLVSEVV